MGFFSKSYPPEVKLMRSNVDSELKAACRSGNQQLIAFIIETKKRTEDGNM